MDDSDSQANPVLFKVHAFVAVMYDGRVLLDRTLSLQERHEADLVLVSTRDGKGLVVNKSRYHNPSDVGVLTHEQGLALATEYRVLRSSLAPQRW